MENKKTPKQNKENADLSPKYVVYDKKKYFVGTLIGGEFRSIARGFDDVTADLEVSATHPDYPLMRDIMQKQAAMADYIDDISYEMPKEEHRKNWRRNCQKAIIFAVDGLEEAQFAYEKIKDDLRTGEFDELMTYNKYAIDRLKTILVGAFNTMSYNSTSKDVFNPFLQTSYRRGKNVVKDVKVETISSGYFDKGGIVKKEIVHIEKKKSKDDFSAQ